MHGGPSDANGVAALLIAGRGIANGRLPLLQFKIASYVPHLGGKLVLLLALKHRHKI